MALGDDAHEFGFGVGHVRERLRRLGIRIEDHEVHRMARFQRDADFGVLFESADAGAVSRARIDDDERAQPIVDDDVLRRHDAHERVTNRPLERPRVGKDFVFVG